MICLLITAVSSVIIAFREIVLRRRIRRARKTADGSFLLALSSLFAAVTMADGKTTDDEIGTVTKIFSEMGLTPAERAMCVGNFVLARRAKSRKAGEDGMRFDETLNRDARLLLFGLLWRVANADGRLAAEEERLLGEIGAKLGLGTDVVARFRTDGLPPMGERALDEAGVPQALIQAVRTQASD